MGVAILSGLGAVGALMLACVAVVVIAVSGVVLIGRSASTFELSDRPPARRLCVALAVALVAAFASLVATGGTSSSAQVFAQGGAERWLASPVIYSAFAAVLVFDRRSPSPLRRYLPRFLGTPTGLLIALALGGVAVELITASDSITTVAQGLTLVGGFGMFLVAGRLSMPWDAPTQRTFGLAIGAAAIAATVLGRSPASLPALVIPVMVAAIAVGLLGRGVNRVARVLALIGGLTITVLQYEASASSNDPSAGLSLQIAVCGGLVIIAAVPRGVRAMAALVVGALIVVGIATSPLPQLTIGQGVTDTDVTLSQRAFETQAVWQKVGASPVTLVLGAGPGATVDLTYAPDRATLAASGRTLNAVPSVHLLTSYLLLKFGLLGLAWLAAIVLTMLRLSWAELKVPRPSLFGVLLLTLSWSCLAAAIPAATFFLSDPLCALSIGLLLGRASMRSSREGPSSPRVRRLRMVRSRYVPREVSQGVVASGTSGP